MMSLPCITISSGEVRHFNGNDFVSWKYLMSLYLYEMNLQVWWMVDISLSHALEDCPQTQTQKKYIYLEAQASNALSGALSTEIKNEVKMEYGWPERVNLLWKVLEQMYGSSNSKKLSSSAMKNISSSSTLYDLSQEGQNLPIWEDQTVRFPKPEGSVLIEQKISYLKKMITLHQVLMMMMAQMMSMMNKNSWWSLRNS
jgi:hypothetical protein